MSSLTKKDIVCRALPNGEQSQCYLFSPATDKVELTKITDFIHRIDQHLKSKFKSITDSIPAYDSLTLVFNDDPISSDTILAEINSLFGRSKEAQASQNKLVEIAVYYDRRTDSELQQLAKHLKLDIETIIGLHSQTDYKVAMLGFQPGFVYLSGLPEALHYPRKESPSLKVPAGAVAIGGSQTGIYSRSSPGGWWVIGQTPMNLFDLKNQPPNKLNSGDRVRFLELSRTEFEALHNEF